MKKQMGLWLMVGLLLMPFDLFSECRGFYSGRTVFHRSLENKINPEGTENCGFTFNRICFDDTLSEMIPAAGFFCEKVEKKYRFFDEAYTKEVPLGPGSLSTRIAIRKPVIYSSVTRIYKHLKSECRKGNISRQKAETDYNHILDVALTALYSDTEEFELCVRSLKTIEERIELFCSVQLTD